MPISKGNTITIPTQFLGGAEGKKITVRWQQTFRDRHEDYWICKWTNKTTPGDQGVIFVQASKLEQLKSRKVDGDDLTVVVSDEFQYGQKKDQSNRFLVYHDKSNKPYQHRFMENTLTSLGSKGADFVISLGYSDVSKVEDILKHFIGDYLKDF
ncbi:uncharacterized protein BO95DRAFT_171834 [Aspergillus brunneoviolaceus CBS 621.78]|uniref:Uncharacterized protein n=2 Tax=Aspergillus TaxID=5052 RepID=A0A8G1RWV9_9EURO|nr:hypothetical protein BO95DRAFT_171834 [Aspergillus brunneoviolaceus CBS 621.78]XP_040805527.1 uncharacterized protein BO72DRAFT_444516 [Aspergillus fijiensis CBS 313.89]RAH44657.1 hypothetical protein BO95DRAFT_171834 [Aspergillus brunneoviolaceus CBS 621.78]RAK81517.1 hypothetical protein BO72DRAFT_444516 [Aspergillus fijiensis CBS 313.89]